MNENAKAPVEHVGGPQDDGPWPDHVEEIVEGKAYRRPVQLHDGSTQEVEVNIKQVAQHIGPDGELTSGYTVVHQFDDPTLGGGN